MPNIRDHSRRLLKFARTMRHAQTEAERKMWFLLRDKKLNNYKFRRQHPVADYIVDFFCIKSKLVVALDGGQHNDADQMEYDARRTDKLTKLGIQVLRFWDHDVLLDGDAVLETIYNSLEPSPQPSPGVPGEGVYEPVAFIPSPGTPGEG